MRMDQKTGMDRPITNHRVSKEWSVNKGEWTLLSLSDSSSSSSRAESMEDAEAMGPTGAEKRGQAEEPAEKRAKSPEKLFPPHFAGDVRKVTLDGEVLETGDEEIAVLRSDLGEFLAKWIKDTWEKDDGEPDAR